MVLTTITLEHFSIEICVSNSTAVFSALMYDSVREQS